MFYLARGATAPLASLAHTPMVVTIATQHLKSHRIRRRRTLVTICFTQPGGRGGGSTPPPPSPPGLYAYGCDHRTHHLKCHRIRRRRTLVIIIANPGRYAKTDRKFYYKRFYFNVFYIVSSIFINVYYMVFSITKKIKFSAPWLIFYMVIFNFLWAKAAKVAKISKTF